MPASQLYRNGMYWTATGSGTIGGVPYTDGDIIYVTGDPDAPYLLESEVTFNVYDPSTDGYNAGTGFYMDASGRFSLGSQLTYDGAGNLTISGTLSAATGDFSGAVEAEAFTLVDGDGDEQAEFGILNPGTIAERYGFLFQHKDFTGTSSWGPSHYSSLAWRDGTIGLELIAVDGTNSDSCTMNLRDTTLDVTFVDGGAVAGEFQFDQDGVFHAEGLDISGSASIGSTLDMNGSVITDVNEVRASYGSAADPSYTFNDEEQTGIYGLADRVAFTVQNSTKGFFDADEFHLTVPIHAGDGTAASPTYTFNSDTDTGAYRAGSNIYRVACGGADKMSLSSTAVIFPEVYANTTASGANVNVSTNGTLLRSTSARRYKKNIFPLTLEEAKAVTRFEAVTYQSKVDDDGGRWYVGQIAEQVDEHDTRYVQHDEDGAVQGIDYERQVAALCLLTRDLYDRINELEARLDG